MQHLFEKFIEAGGEFLHQVTASILYNVRWIRLHVLWGLARG
jgi:hypothetical protein